MIVSTDTLTEFENHVNLQIPIQILLYNDCIYVL